MWGSGARRHGRKPLIPPEAQGRVGAWSLLTHLQRGRHQRHTSARGDGSTRSKPRRRFQILQPRRPSHDEDETPVRGIIWQSRNIRTSEELSRHGRRRRDTLRRSRTQDHPYLQRRVEAQPGSAKMEPGRLEPRWHFIQAGSRTPRTRRESPRLWRRPPGCTGASWVERSDVTAWSGTFQSSIRAHARSQSSAAAVGVAGSHSPQEGAACVPPQR